MSAVSREWETAAAAIRAADDLARTHLTGHVDLSESIVGLLRLALQQVSPASPELVLQRLDAADEDRELLVADGAALDRIESLLDLIQARLNGRVHESSSRVGDEGESSSSGVTVGEPSDGSGEVASSPDLGPSDTGLSGNEASS